MRYPAYSTMASGDTDVPESILMAWVQGDRGVSIDETRGRLSESSRVDIDQIEPTGERSSSAARWELRVQSRGDDPIDARIWLETADREIARTIEALELGSHFGVTDDDLEATDDSVWAFGVKTALGDRPLERFHAQLTLLHVVAPDPALVLDANTETPHPGVWLDDVAAAQTPPSPTTLFTIHNVHQEDGGPVWLHTHGLARCGLIELDMVDVPGEVAGLAAELLRATALRFLDHGAPEPDEPFVVGSDMELLWLPWEEGVRKVPRRVPGSARDRDESHVGRRGLLFAPERALLGRRKYQSPAVYRPILESQPVLYISDAETRRMAALANERIGELRGLFQGFGQQEDWLFMVKLGYPVDDARDANHHEHLWFTVHDFSDGVVDATLENEPFDIASMSEGERSLHSLDKLSDWLIICPHGQFGPGQVRALERFVGRR